MGRIKKYSPYYYDTLRKKTHITSEFIDEFLINGIDPRLIIPIEGYGAHETGALGCSFSDGGEQAS